MFITPYDTTICKSHPVQAIRNSLIKANIADPFPQAATTGGGKYKALYVVTPDDNYDDIKGFTQPIEFAKGKWVIDARPFMRAKPFHDGTYGIIASNDYAFHTIRAALTMVLARDGIEPFDRLSDMPSSVFIRWFSQGISQKLNLDINTQIRLAVITAFYYASLFEADVDFIQKHKDQLIPVIQKATKATMETVIEIADLLEPMQNANEYLAQVNKHGQSIRLSEFKYADLYNLLFNSWVGFNQRENAAVAFEHIPTFIAMLYNSVTDKSYRKTTINTRRETVGNSREWDQFAMSVSYLIRDELV